MNAYQPRKFIARISLHRPVRFPSELDTGQRTRQYQTCCYDLQTSKNVHPDGHLESQAKETHFAENNDKLSPLTIVRRE